MSDDRYTWNEVLHSVRNYWAIRHHGCGDSVSEVRMLDVSRAWDTLSVGERRELFLGVWVEQGPIPAGVLAKMTHYLNGDT